MSRPKLSEGDELDPHDAALLSTTLSLTVDQRMQRLIDYVRFVEAGRRALRSLGSGARA